MDLARAQEWIERALAREVHQPLENGAGGAIATSLVARLANAAELPACVRREKVARAQVAHRAGAGLNPLLARLAACYIVLAVANQPQTSVILAGGVVKSAFAAGAIKVMTDRGVLPTHVVAASAGALNGILYAAAIRAGVERDSANRLETLWLQEGDWWHGIDFSASALLHLQGVATTDKLLNLMRREVDPVATMPARRDTIFTVVVTSMDGQTSPIDGQPTTTFEREETFSGDDYASAAGRERMYQVCAASCAFPILFAPVKVPGIGPCIDGGAVNNSPIGIAMEAGAERVILIAPTAAALSPHGAATGIDLVSQLAEILIGERLYRDVRQTAATNHVLTELDQMVASGQLTETQRTAVKELPGWKRRVELISIRPTTPLRGNVFSGLVDAKLRAEYVAAGRAAAIVALDAHGIGGPGSKPSSS
jgi:NTE family protein